MIQGTFGEKGQLWFEIELVTRDGLSLPTEAMLDTGFTEHLVINKQDLQALEWNFLRKDTLLTGKGEASFDIYFGQIILDRSEFQIPVFAGDDIQEILLGSQWLKRFKLVADYQENVLTLG